MGIAVSPKAIQESASNRATSPVTVRVLDGFDDPTFGPDQWGQLLCESGQNIVYSTWHYQKAWWETFGKGSLILIAATQADRVVALAPLYHRSGVVYFVGNAYWEADKLDFIGDIGGPGVLDAILETAADVTPHFSGFRLEFVPESSRTGELLQAAANRLNLSCYEEWEEKNLIADLSRQAPAVLSAAYGKRLRKRERSLSRRGELQVKHVRDGKAILTMLPEFFRQHIRRWEGTGKPSLFLEGRHQLFYERLTECAAQTGWLRYSWLECGGNPVAHHYGFSYHGRYSWNVGSFAVDFADLSPGQILLKHLLEAAIDEEATAFDFGAGDQAFKQRLATDQQRVKGWGLFPKSNYKNTDLPPVQQNDESAASVGTIRKLSSSVSTRILEGFDDPAFGRQEWNELLQSSSVDSVFLTWEFQRAWWESLGGGELLLIVAERDGRVIALAPFYQESHMIYFLGTGFESDYLDFIGDIGESEVLDLLLQTARNQVEGFLGFHLYFVSDKSGTGERLQAAATRLGLSSYSEEEAQPILDIAGDPEAALAATKRKSLLRHENFFRRDGTFEVLRLHNGEEISPHLEEYFDQHIKRWEGTDNPSRFTYDKARLLISHLTRLAADTGWLRFTRLNWQGRAIAFDYGFCYRGRYVRGTPSFAADLARYRPGEVLFRQTLLAAIEEGAHTFDFRTGQQPFKVRFASEIVQLRTWGLYEH